MYKASKNWKSSVQPNNGFPRWDRLYFLEPNNLDFPTSILATIVKNGDVYRCFVTYNVVTRQKKVVRSTYCLKSSVSLGGAKQFFKRFFCSDFELDLYFSSVDSWRR